MLHFCFSFRGFRLCFLMGKTSQQKSTPQTRFRTQNKIQNKQRVFSVAFEYSVSFDKKTAQTTCQPQEQKPQNTTKTQDPKTELENMF